MVSVFSSLLLAAVSVDAVSVAAAVSCLDAQAAREQTMRMLRSNAIIFFHILFLHKIVWLFFDVIIIRA